MDDFLLTLSFENKKNLNNQIETLEKQIFYIYTESASLRCFICARCKSLLGILSIFALESMRPEFHHPSARWWSDRWEWTVVRHMTVDGATGMKT